MLILSNVEGGQLTGLISREPLIAVPGLEPGTFRVELGICSLKINTGTGVSSSKIVSLYQYYRMSEKVYTLFYFFF
jgi:hypothetical protein